jgi:hypothetical protein
MQPILEFFWGLIILRSVAYYGRTPDVHFQSLLPRLSLYFAGANPVGNASNKVKGLVASGTR